MTKKKFAPPACSNNEQTATTIRVIADRLIEAVRPGAGIIPDAVLATDAEAVAEDLLRLAQTLCHEEPRAALRRRIEGIEYLSICDEEPFDQEANFTVIDRRDDGGGVTQVGDDASLNYLIEHGCEAHLSSKHN